MKTMTTSLWLLLLALSAIWGGAFVFNGLALQSFGTLTVVASRLLLGGVILNGVLFLSGRRYPRSWKWIGAFLLLGLLNNALPFSLIVWGQTRIAAGTASIIIAASPLFTIVLAHFFTQDERLNARRFIGVLVGIAGVIVLIGPAVLKESSSDPLPRLAVLGAAVSYSIAGIFSKRFSQAGIDPLTISSGQLLASSLITLPLALIMEKPWTVMNPQGGAITGILGLGILSTAVAYIMYFRIIEKAGAGNTMLVTMIIPFFALFLGSLILGEGIEFRELAALGILVSSLLIIDGRLVTLLKSGTAGKREKSGKKPPTENTRD